MPTHFESFGNFTTGISSYWALTSKKSRGTIQLTEKSFYFKSEKDKILYDIKISNIENFYLIKKFKALIIELITNQGIYYDFLPQIQQKKIVKASHQLTRELFRSLVRVTYRGDYPILFETKGAFIKEKKNESFIKETRRYGITLLTEDYILFKSYKEQPAKKIAILEIDDILLKNDGSDNIIQIKAKDGKQFSITALKSKSKQYRKDKLKTEKLYKMLIQAKEYKISEMIKKREEDERRIKRLKSIFEVSNKVRLDMVRLALNMDEKTFTNKIFDWAKKFKFIIDGDYLIVNLDTITEFINNVMGFDSSYRRELKTNCISCNERIDYTARICPYCGKEQTA